MSTLAGVVGDLRAETRVLDRLIESLKDEDWFTPTPAVGWDIRDTVGHLADTDELMYHSITGGERNMMAEAQAAAGDGELSPDAETVDRFTAQQVEKVRKIAPAEVYRWWRSATSQLHDQLEACDPKGRYPWGPNMVSPLSLASARLMETWAHSLDVHDAVGAAYEDTDRLRHIAYLGLRAIPYAFALVGLPSPAPVRLELTSPGDELWELGPDDAPNVIAGSASDWCRVAARRDRDGSARRLGGEGPDASAVIANARAFL